MELRSKIPAGLLAQKWDARRDALKLVSPANKRKHRILVVGSGLAGASAAASLAELGYPVTCFCFQDSPRRAHSIAAQGGINAAKNYPNDDDSVSRLFQDTIKGGDFRSREANVFRLALSRDPTATESAKFVAVLAECKGDADRREAVEDVFWAVMTGKEFLFNH